MAHYAFLDNNIVTEVIVGIDETELIEGLSPEVWYGNFRKQPCVRTSYNGNIRKQFCGIGFTYLADADVFVAPQPYLSWTLDSNHDWQPPTPKPSDASIENPYEWNEEDLEWVAI
jgi:hypothetical protein